MATRGSHAHRRPAKRRRAVERRRGVGAPILVSLAAAVAILALGASGTLSSWSQAIIRNDSNSVATATAVVLQETQGSNTCVSSSVASNSSTCSTINKYGGTATPLVPGGSQTVDVVFKNTGQANASSFVVTPAACSQAPAASAGSVGDLCGGGDLTVAMSCVSGTGPAWTDLTYAAAAPPTAAKTHAAAGGDLNAGQSWTCHFTVALASNAAVTDQGITVSQALTWTLNK